jgi:hypothetical protein
LAGERETLVDRKFIEGIPYKADPTPCPRCNHREDVHEPFRNTRYCRHCEWIGSVYPCSRRSVGAQQSLDSLSFDLEL